MNSVTYEAFRDELTSIEKDAMSAQEVKAFGGKAIDALRQAPLNAGIHADSLLHKMTKGKLDANRLLKARSALPTSVYNGI
jgi:hypothetical protein